MAKKVAKKVTKKQGKTKGKRKLVKATLKAKTKKSKAIKATATKVTGKISAKKTTAVKTETGKPKTSIGSTVGDFTLNATGGKQVSLSDLKGKNVVIYFYPKDDTPGCTIEGKDFTRLHNEFNLADTAVFGVSRDSVESHEKFKNKYSYSIDLLSDQDETFCKHFGVIKPKNMYGKTVIGIERSTFVIDRDGVLRREWRKVSVDGHAEEVLDFVKSL